MKIKILGAEGVENFENRLIKGNFDFMEFYGKIWLHFDQYNDFGTNLGSKMLFFSILKKLIKFQETFWKFRVIQIDTGHKTSSFENFRKLFFENEMKHGLSGYIKLQNFVGPPKFISDEYLN